MQFEYRPWISEGTDEFNIGEYVTIKAKLEMRYGYKSMEDNESDCNGADECSGLVKKEKGPRKLRPIFLVVSASISGNCFIRISLLYPACRHDRIGLYRQVSI